jgi:undecaprenyl diphosphate synthase
MKAEMKQLQQAVPVHLGLILDGNRRWARENGLPQLEGHKKGYENLLTIGLAAIDKGVRYVSAFVFSTENWHRSKEEVSYLMNLLTWVATHEVGKLHAKNIRVRFLGSRQKLSKGILRAIDSAEEKTKNNSGGTLALCLNYGGKQELVDAFSAIIARGDQNDITEQLISDNLYAPEIPAIDLLIRTSGEQRLSNFMLWRAAYSELLFVEKHWPAFTEDDLNSAFTIYSNRQRRFGK